MRRSRSEIPPPGPGQRDTVVNGVRWRSREAQGRDDPVVFLHGVLASSASWEAVLQDAAGGHAAIAVDLPGFGWSDRPWPYDYDAAGQARSVFEFLDARRIGSVLLAGNSLGGAVAMLAAAARPDRVKALLLVDSAAPESPMVWPIRALRTRGLGEIALALATRPLAAHSLRRWQFARAERVTDHVIDDAWKPLAIPGTRRAALAAVRSDPRRYRGLEDRVRVPTLIVWGEKDRMIPVSEGERLARRIRGSRLVTLPDAGHLPQREQPAAFSRVAADFFAAY